MERLLLTGASGLIGSTLQPTLDERYAVTAVDLQPRGRVLAADLAEPESVAALFAQHGPFTYVVHLAADPAVEASWQSVLRNNIQATTYLYEAAHGQRCRRVVFASSNHVTGGYEMRGITEPLLPSVPPLPDSPYGMSKLYGEELARYYYELHGMESICLRIGSVRSPDAPGEGRRMQRAWLSYRDLRALFCCALNASVPFGVYYGTSDNREKLWSIESARQELEYAPKDDAWES